MKSKGYDLIREQVYSDRLLCGMPVFVIKKRGFYSSYAFFATKYGGADRRFNFEGQMVDTPEGVAHFLEHKLFDTEDGNALEILAANGAQPNAFTSSDMTAYYFESTEKFEENLKILLEFVSVPYFTKESVEKEQGIIGQEIGMIEDDPDHVAYYQMLKLLYRNNPVRFSIAGSVESIAEITDETLYKCHKIFYNPTNMALVVVGDVDPDSIYKLAADVLPKTLGSVPKADYVDAEVREPVAHRAETQMEVSEPIFIIGASARYPQRGSERMRCELTGKLTCELIAGKSSPLYNRMYADGLIRDNFATDFEETAGIAFTMFSGSCAEPERVLDELKTEILRIVNGGTDTELFERIKKVEYGRQMRMLNSFDNICYMFANGHFKGYDAFKMTEELLTITSDEVIEFMRENLKPENMAISLVTPKAGEQ